LTVDDAWLTGPPRTYGRFAATRTIDMDAIPESVRDFVGQSVRIYGRRDYDDHLAGLCRAVVGTPFVLADDPGCFDEIEGPEEVWYASRRMLVAPFESVGDCRGATFVVPEGRDQPKLFRSSSARSPSLVQFKRESLRHEAVRSYDADIEEVFGDQEDPGRAADHGTALKWSSGDQWIATYEFNDMMGYEVAFVLISETGKAKPAEELGGSSIRGVLCFECEGDPMLLVSDLDWRYALLVATPEGRKIAAGFREHGSCGI